MKTMHRNKRTIYLCQVYLEGNLKKFREPIKLRENWNINTDSSDLARLGKESYETGTIRTDLTHAKYYHLGDKIYINIEPPIEHDILCRNADFEVSAEPIITLNEVKIPIQLLTGKRGIHN